MKTPKALPLILLTMLSLPVITGCVSSSGTVFGRDEALQAQSVLFGKVVDVREGKIQGTKSAAGAIAGGAMGGVLGNLVGGGKGNNIATVGGAILGAAGGSAAEEALTSKNGIQITVKLDNGNTIVVVQEADVKFTIGQEVRVITGKKTRVQPL